MKPRMLPKPRPETPLYPTHHKPWDLEPHYSRHVGGMTEFDLHEKSDIAMQLAYRDKLLAALQLVALEAAAMLAETNHGGLTHERSKSMQLALEAAGVTIPAQCSFCPHPSRW